MAQANGLYGEPCGAALCSGSTAVSVGVVCCRGPTRAAASISTLTEELYALMIDTLGGYGITACQRYSHGYYKFE